MIGLRQRNFTNVVEVFSLSPFWAGTVLRGVYGCWTASAAATLEIGLALSAGPVESLAGLETCRSLVSPSEFIVPSTSLPGLTFAAAATQFISTVFPVYIPFAEGANYVVIALRTTGAQTVNSAWGLVVEVERQVTGRITAGRVQGEVLRGGGLIEAFATPAALTRGTVGGK